LELELEPELEPVPALELELEPEMEPEPEVLDETGGVASRLLIEPIK
jgi:hypothetical protein